MIVRIIVCNILQIYTIILFVRIILTWVPSPPEPLRPIIRGISAVTDPLLIPLRGMIPPAQIGAMAFDLSPLVLFFGIYLVSRLLGC
jgi:YggT family protein